MENQSTYQPPKKKIWHSKTFWLNVIIVALALVDWVFEYNVIDLAPETFASITAFLNMIMRYITSSPIEPISETFGMEDKSS